MDETETGVWFTANKAVCQATSPGESLRAYWQKAEKSDVSFGEIIMIPDTLIPHCRDILYQCIIYSVITG